MRSETNIPAQNFGQHNIEIHPK